VRRVLFEKEDHCEQMRGLEPEPSIPPLSLAQKRASRAAQRRVVK
jgi:hypothetical protein